MNLIFLAESSLEVWIAVFQEWAHDKQVASPSMEQVGGQGLDALFGSCGWLEHWRATGGNPSTIDERCKQTTLMLCFLY